MSEPLKPPISADPYDLLPVPIRAMVSRQEYRWMSDEQKQSLVFDMTTPEPETDY